MATPFVPNFEEAATVAADFISSIDNLPKEVEHLLEEIRIKDQKCQELLQDVARDQARYVKSALKTVSSSSFSTLGLNSRKSVSPAPITNSKMHLPERIASTYAEIAVLDDEKIALAQSLIKLLSLTKARLDVDLVKVKSLQGEPIEDHRTPSFSQPTQLYPSISLDKRPETVFGINQSLRNATVNTQTEPPGPGYNKRRRITTNTALKLSSPTRGFTPQAVSRPRPSRQAQIIEPEDDDLDAEGEEEYEAEDAEEDSTLYCFCNKQNFGDTMIGCDNPSCQYQWFHISCVGVKHPFPDKWYCLDCRKKGLPSEKRKGRKK